MDEFQPMSDAKMMTARDAFQHLPRRRRREVFRLAKKGRPHPDPAIAQVAYGWARWVMRVDDSGNSESNKLTAAIAILLEIFMGLFGDGGGQALGGAVGGIYTERQIRRIARLIIALGDQNKMSD